MPLSDKEKDQLNQYYKNKDLYNPMKDPSQQHPIFSQTKPENNDELSVTANEDPESGVPGYAYGGGPMIYPSIDPSIGPDLAQSLLNVAESQNNSNPSPDATASQALGAAVPGTTSASQIPTTNPNAASDYINKYNQQADKYGPSQQLELAQVLNDKFGGIGNGLAKAGAGLADAIIQGVGRAGKSDFLSTLNDQEQAARNGATALGPSLNTQNTAAIQQRMQRDSLDPKSPLSQSSQQAYGPLLEKLGFKNGIGNMSAADIQNVTSLSAQYGDARTKNLIAEAGLNLEAGRTNIESQRAQEEAQKAGLGLQENAAKDIITQSQAHPWLQALQDYLPVNLPVTTEQGTTAAKTLQGIGQNLPIPAQGAPQVNIPFPQLPGGLPQGISGQSTPLRKGNIGSLPGQTGVVSSAHQMVRFQSSDGKLHDIPIENLSKAKQRDPGLQVIQ